MGRSARVTPLLDRDPTPEDLEAERDQPRPGVWAAEHVADLRALTQDQTDYLIRYELCQLTPPTELAAMLEALGMAAWWTANSPPSWALRLEKCAAHRQRGGIDSDPLVRVLARRAWGDRDRQWFEVRGVRKRPRPQPRPQLRPQPRTAPSTGASTARPCA
jgi:hypothetical protein